MTDNREHWVEIGDRGLDLSQVDTILENSGRAGGTLGIGLRSGSTIEFVVPKDKEEFKKRWQRYLLEFGHEDAIEDLGE